MQKQLALKNLHKKAQKDLNKKLVFSDGNPDSNIMMIGEAPGEKEEKHGKPFVGMAGKFLDKNLQAVGLSRNDVYITNVVLWRPPNNRKPLKPEVEQCRHYLVEQIKIINPKVICTLGNTPLDFFVKGKSITKDHGKLIKTKIDNKDITIFPTFHPAAIFYNRTLKELFEKDIKKLKRYL